MSSGEGSVVSGVPQQLAAYSDATVPTLEAVRVRAVQLRSAIERAEREPSEVAVPLEDRTTRVTGLVEVLEVLDREPAAVGWALEAADRSASAPSVFGPPVHHGPARRAADGEAFAGLVAEAVRAHAAQPGGGGLTSPQGLALSVTAVSQLAKRSPGSLDRLVERVTLGASRPGPRTWRLVGRGGDPVGVVLAGVDDWERSAEDPLATRGERMASAASAAVFEGTGGLAGTALGGLGGAALGGPPGGVAGAVGGGLVGGGSGRRARQMPFVEHSEDAVAGFIDRLGGTAREPDRYDELLEEP